MGIRVRAMPSWTGDAAGKTALADRLASSRVGGPLKVLRAGIDGRHNPRRFAIGVGVSVQGAITLDSYDLGHLRRELLDPLGPTGSHEYRLARFNFQTDNGVDEGTRRANEPHVLVSDGVFLLRSELADYWELLSTLPYHPRRLSNVGSKETRG